MAEPDISPVRLRSFEETRESFRDPLEHLCLAAENRTGTEAVAQALQRLQGQLSLLFEVEESDLNEAVAHAPELIRRASDLLQLRASLLKTIDDLLRQVNAATPTPRWWDEFAAKVNRFIGDLLGYESAERRLLDDAFEMELLASGIWHDLCSSEETIPTL
jgi:hypothetical protein